MSFIMKNLKSGEIVMIESLSKAYEMMESHEWLFGFISFLTKEQFDESISASVKE